MNILVNSLINDSPSELGLSKGIIQFESIDLTSLCSSNVGYMIKNGNTLSLDNIDLETYVSELTDGGNVLNKKYGLKQVTFQLFIQGENHDDLINKIIELKKQTNKTNGSLYITYGGIVYKYIATVGNLTVPNISTLEDFIDDIGISFTITSPHGIIEEPIVFTGNFDDNFQKIINNTGSYKTYGKIYLIGKTGSTISNINLEIKKPGEVTGKSINFDVGLTNGKVCIIDYENKTITLDGVEVVFSGFMMPFEVGNNVLDFTFIGDVNITTYILYNKIML